MSLISLDMIGMMLDDLNHELHFKITENKAIAADPKNVDFLVLITNGNIHIIHFMGIEIYNSAFTEMVERPTIEKEMEGNTRERFEKYIRLCIQDELDVLAKITMV